MVLRLDVTMAEASVECDCDSARGFGGEQPGAARRQSRSGSRGTVAVSPAVRNGGPLDAVSAAPCHPARLADVFVTLVHFAPVESRNAKSRSTAA